MFSKIAEKLSHHPDGSLNTSLIQPRSSVSSSSTASSSTSLALPQPETTTTIATASSRTYTPPTGTPSSKEMALQIKEQNIQIFVSYNLASKNQVDAIETTFNEMGIQLLRDQKEQRKLENSQEFMKKVVKEADYTISVINDAYLKSFNGLFEVITTLKDPYWKDRNFPILMPEINLDDKTILFYENHWQTEAELVESTGRSSTEVAIAKEGAKIIGPYLHWIRGLQSAPLDIQLSTKFQKMMADMLLRQKTLEKKGIQRQAFVNCPLARNKCFTPREEKIGLLENTLNKEQYGAIAIVGKEGTGTTQLALEYAYKHQNEYDKIYWVRAADLETIKSDLVTIGRECGLGENFLKDDIIFSTIEGVFENKKNWLLVLDNSEHPEKIASIMPQAGGHVIITSQNSKWKKTVSVDFNKEEALLHLKRISGVTGQDDELKLLAKDLGYLPQALTFAGVYIRNQQIDVATYRRAFNEKQKSVRHVKGYPDAVITAGLMSMEKVAQENANAIKLLNICSYLAPDKIPHAVLEAWLKEKNKKDDGFGFHNALRELESYALINQKVDYLEGDYKKWVSIPLLIQTLTRNQNQQEAKNTILLGVRVLKEQLTEEKWETRDALFSHCQAIITHAEAQNATNEQLGALLYELGTFLWKSGNLRLAREYLEKALKVTKESSRTENHINVAKCCNNLGLVIYNQGAQLNVAKELLEKGFNIISSWKVADVDVDESLCYHMGLVLKTLGDLNDTKEAITYYQKAEKYFEKALKLKSKRLRDENHIDIADIYDNLGALLIACHTGPLYSRNTDKAYAGKAKNFFDKAIEIKLACLKSENQTQVAESYDNFGSVFLALEELPTAKEYYEKALRIRQACFHSENHISIAVNQRKIAYVTSEPKNKKMAFEKALKTSKTSLDTETHSEVALINQHLGLLLRQSPDEAKSYNEKALKIFINCWNSENHISVARAYANLSNVQNEKESLNSLKKALEIAKNCCGEESYDVGMLYHILANNKINAKDVKEYAMKAQKIIVSHIGEDNVFMISVYSRLGLAQLMLGTPGDLKDAKESFEKQLKIGLALGYLESNPYSVVETYITLGNLLLETFKDPKQAKQMYTEAKEIVQKKYPQNITYIQSLDKLITKCG